MWENFAEENFARENFAEENLLDKEPLGLGRDLDLAKYFNSTMLLLNNERSHCVYCLAATMALYWCFHTFIFANKISRINFHKLQNTQNLNLTKFSHAMVYMNMKPYKNVFRHPKNGTSYLTMGKYQGMFILQANDWNTTRTGQPFYPFHMRTKTRSNPG